MFYSHEILTSTQYGVATIWLIATVGKSNQKRLTRKAIQGVDVPKACETIIEPGAPLALRLQGNLLYGVSRVYSQQCHYVLSDAEKTQSNMMTFFRAMNTNETVPNAGKAKRQQITLQDDPSFDPLSVVPKLDLLASVDDLVFLSTQLSTQNNVSQMTPMTQGTSSSGRGGSLLNFGIPQSSLSGRNYRLPTDLEHNFPIPFHAQESLEEFGPFGEDMPDLDLNFDVDGNLIGLDHLEPELPALPGTAAYDEQLHVQAANAANPDAKQERDADDNVFIMGEDPLPDAEPFSKLPAATNITSNTEPTARTTETLEIKAPLRRGRPRRKHQMIDKKDYIPSAQIRQWSTNYHHNMKAVYKSRPTTTTTQARRNAKALLFGNGLAGVAKPPLGPTHPLARKFSGMVLLAQLQGRDPEHERELQSRGRRRTSAEAFPDEQNAERNIRQRTESQGTGDELGRGRNNDVGAIIFGEDLAPEIGLDTAKGLEDRHSSSMAPWSRPPSVAPGSSLRGQGSVQKKNPAPSPLHSRGSMVRSIERFSDLPDLPHNFDDMAILHSQVSPVGNGGFIGDFDFADSEETQNSGVIDTSALDFLGYATARVQERGYSRPCDPVDRRWIDFNTLTDELDGSFNAKKFVSEAFMHVLVLATKNAIAVEQEGIADNRPFGTIRIGLIPFEQNVDEMADEQA
ncbi:hypothetical protein FLONG3_8590 [Fusarium longipes]|uniref:Rad21/Rec8-like protein N-terminal domain-containing protein n=1 Tax=Fusarium longipes TaxID=694270 RepID=A0A395S4N0_9HYPO|nr:hypothetical protein FLONG3_8590 [Fusarium longipes]